MTLFGAKAKAYLERLLFTRQLRIVLIVKFTEFNAMEENRLYYYFLA